MSLEFEANFRSSLASSAGVAEAEPRDMLAMPQWYAACTRSRAEKVVAEQLAHKEMEYFLPLCRTLRRWQSRAAEVDLPLFPGYVFVRMALQDRLRALTVSGVAYLVHVAGRPAPIPAAQIETLRERLAAGVYAEPYHYLAVGDRVRVIRGALEGLEGILVRKRSKARLVLSLDLIMRSIAVDVDAADIEPVASRAPVAAVGAEELSQAPWRCRQEAVARI